MIPNLKSRLRSGELLLGTMITLPSPDVTEIMALAGFDWLFIDGEHGPFDASNLGQILRAASDHAACLVRVPAIEEVPLKQALDLGAAGIIVPKVNTANEAAQIVDWCRYPPHGSRGIGLARAHGFGHRSSEYMTAANSDLLVIVQAEHREAVENIESIVAVDGIDCVFVGPHDLSASFGKTGQVDDPEVVAAIDRVVSVCQSRQMPLGFFGMAPHHVQPWVDRGVNLICVGVDAALLADSAKQIRAAFTK
ncbi:MAG: HpcH/HpaI aldolase family protein [Pirellulaceae bacterium]